MPKYRVEMTDGRILEVEADAPPSEQDILAHLQSGDASTTQQPPPPTPAQPSSRLSDALGFGLDAALKYSPIGDIREPAYQAGNIIKAHPIETAATAGAMLAVPFTAGASASIPIAMAAAGLGGAGGAGLGIAGRQVISGKPEETGAVLKEMALEGGMQALGEGTGAVIAKGLTGTGRNLMQRALKPSKASTKTVTPRELAQTMLDEGLNPTKRGFEKADELIGTLDEQVRPMVEEAATYGVGINPTRAANVDRAKAAFAGVDPAADLNRIQGVQDRFLARNVDEIPIDEAFDVTRKEGQILRKKFGETKTATVEAKKDIRSNMRQQVRDAMKDAGFDIGPTMDREAALMKTLGPIADRARVGGNLNPLGLAPLAHSPLGFLSFLLDRAPGVVGGTARGVYQTGKAVEKSEPAIKAMLRAAILQRLGLSDDDSLQNPPPQ